MNQEHKATIVAALMAHLERNPNLSEDISNALKSIQSERYEYCTTFGAQFSRELHGCPLPTPKGEGWEFVSFGVGSNGNQDDFDASGVVLWRRPIPDEKAIGE